MRIMNGPVPLNVVPLLGLVLSLFALSSRYYTSAAYERPIHLIILTLITTGLCLAATAQGSRLDHGPSRRFLKVFHPSSTTTSSSSSSALDLPTHSSGVGKGKIARVFISSVDQIRHLRAPFCTLLICIILRTFLFWLIVRTTQCAYPGAEAFLPFLVLLLDGAGLSAIRLPGCSLKENTKSRQASSRSGATIAYGFVALVWGFAAVSALGHLRTATGTACPPGLQWRPLVLGAQALACVIDAAIVVSVADLRRHEAENGDVSHFLSVLLLAAALCVFLVAFPTLLVDSKLYWTFCLHFSDLKDLTIDVLTATAALLSIYSLLPLLHPTTISLVLGSLGLFGSHIPRLGAGLLYPTLPLDSAINTFAATAGLLMVLGCLTLHPSNTPQPFLTALLHRWLAVIFIVVCLLSFITTALLPSPQQSTPLRKIVDELLATADSRAKVWEGQAATSQTLEEAVGEYRRRYGLLPPPNFDKWYSFAKEHQSPIIDDFDQIHHDLLPFWGLEPGLVRSRTSHLLNYASLEMGGLRIRGGVVQQSPYVSGSHRWMLTSLEHMIEPFAKWLPDMDLAINLSDECRMAIPFEDMQKYQAEAQRAREEIMERNQESQNGTKASRSDQSRLPEAFAEPFPMEVTSPYFSNNIRWQLYYDLIAPTCPPDSPARNRRWWDRSTSCADCITPHSILTDDAALVADVEMANNLCHQPDMAYLDGFIMSPSAMVGTKALFPIFSQGRVGGFSDILIPSPWNYDRKSPYVESADLSWAEKINGLFWRGSSSDGYAAHGSWTGFLRARFVHEAYRKRTNPTTDAETSPINVSFAGGMSRCHQADCAAELHAFRSWGRDLQPVAPQDGNVENQPEVEERVGKDAVQDLSSFVTPFEEHWRFRHLIDMDGAGFSGRFLPFLKSRSLVYRAALFRAWFDERLRAWHHYVPVDVRLGSGFWALFDFFSGHEENKHSRRTAEDAQRIAEQGREWAQKALRAEDMQIYMFRLLLEWGRVIDDNRENLQLEVQ